MNIYWYPGHMKKTKDLVKEQLKLVDVIFELLDARIPISSKNPDIDSMIGTKPKVVILNKADLADSRATTLWVEYFEEKGIIAIPVNSVGGKGLHDVMKVAEMKVKEKMDALIKKGRRARAIRVMVVGIPNVGKSSIINKLGNKKSARTGDKPGVTKGKQWVRLRGNVELLDTPGILWPKFEDPEVGKKLAYTGAIKDELLDTETLALYLIENLLVGYKANLVNKYKLVGEMNEPLDVLNEIAKNRGFIVKGGEPDYLRTANIILDEFRASTIGKITLERPSVK
ncbi:MAG: ribosome biogenesis GTPase YlqF [Clostridiales bacterium]|nr:ribosome biogenesis GTPase YlqF [Clostridiales bacterium]